MEVIKPGHVALCILSSMLYYPDEDDPTFSNSIQQRLRDIVVKEVRRVDEVTHPSLVGLLDSIKVKAGWPGMSIPSALSYSSWYGKK